MSDNMRDGEDDYNQDPVDINEIHMGGMMPELLDGHLDEMDPLTV